MMKNRYEFMFFLQAENCNPNGDPDMGNYPRIDPETMEGIITDVAIKRRIRNYIETAYEHKYGMDIIKRDASNMNKSIAELVLEVNGGKLEKPQKGDFKNKKVDEVSELACTRYWDVRTFGDVLSTGINSGQIRGPVQIGISKSIDPILPIDTTITRNCYSEGKFLTLEEYDELDKSMDPDKKRTMGRKNFIPYGLYIVKGSISPNLANKTGFSEEDINILWESIMGSYENDISASKKGMSVLQPMIIFKHIGTDNTTDQKQRERETMLGCVPAYKLYETINVVKREGIEYPRNYTDYDVKIDMTNMPKGIEVGFKMNPFDDVVWGKLPETEKWIKAI